MPLWALTESVLGDEEITVQRGMSNNTLTFYPSANQGYPCMKLCSSRVFGKHRQRHTCLKWPPKAQNSPWLKITARGAPNTELA